MINFRKTVARNEPGNIRFRKVFLLIPRTLPFVSCTKYMKAGIELYEADSDRELEWRWLGYHTIIECYTEEMRYKVSDETDVYQYPWRGWKTIGWANNVDHCTASQEEDNEMASNLEIEIDTDDDNENEVSLAAQANFPPTLSMDPLNS